jgi:hypothetical protein
VTQASRSRWPIAPESRCTLYALRNQHTPSVPKAPGKNRHRLPLGGLGCNAAKSDPEKRGTYNEIAASERLLVQRLEGL